MGGSSGAEMFVCGSELESFSVDTPGGRIHIRWDHEASATPNAQLAFFAETGYSLDSGSPYRLWLRFAPFLSQRIINL